MPETTTTPNVDPIETTATPPAPTPTAPVSIDPTTGLPTQKQVKADPLTDPVVAGKIKEYEGQISNLTKSAAEKEKIAKELAEAKAKLKAIEDAKLSEEQKREKEFKEALESSEAAKKAAEQANLEAAKLRVFINSGLSPDFLRFVQGSTEDEIKESVSALSDLVKARAEQAQTTAPVPPVPNSAPTSTVTNPPAPKPKTFTMAEVARMSPDEYKKNREAILQAAAKNELK